MEIHNPQGFSSQINKTIIQLCFGNEIGYQVHYDKSRRRADKKIKWVCYYVSVDTYFSVLIQYQQNDKTNEQRYNLLYPCIDIVQQG